MKVCQAITTLLRPWRRPVWIPRKPRNLPPNWPPGPGEDLTTPDRASAILFLLPRWLISAPIRESRRLAGWCFGKSASGFEPAIARQALAWIILSPEDGQAITKAPELGCSGILLNGSFASAVSSTQRNTSAGCLERSLTDQE